MVKLVERATYSRRRGRAYRATPEQVEAWRAVIRAYGAMARSAEPALRAAGLDGSDYDVLETLAQGPAEGLRPTELADRVLLTKSGMTRLVDRLAERGLVDRRECPTDRRGQLVALAPAGRRVLRRASPDLLRRMRIALDVLSPSDLAALKRASIRIEEAARALD